METEWKAELDPSSWTAAVTPTWAHWQMCGCWRNGHFMISYWLLFLFVFLLKRRKKHSLNIVAMDLHLYKTTDKISNSFVFKHDSCLKSDVDLHILWSHLKETVLAQTHQHIMAEMYVNKPILYYFYYYYYCYYCYTNLSLLQYAPRCHESLSALS